MRSDLVERFRGRWVALDVIALDVEGDVVADADELGAPVHVDGSPISVANAYFSLSEDMAKSFGTRFMFRVHGPFHAIAALRHSGVKLEEQELIGSGRYRVLEASWEGDMQLVDLAEEGLLTLK